MVFSLVIFSSWLLESFEGEFDSGKPWLGFLGDSLERSIWIEAFYDEAVSMGCTWAFVYEDRSIVRWVVSTDMGREILDVILRINFQL